MPSAGEDMEALQDVWSRPKHPQDIWSPRHLLCAETIRRGPSVLMDALGRTKFQGPLGMDHMSYGRLGQDSCLLTYRTNMTPTYVFKEREIIQAP